MLSANDIVLIEESCEGVNQKFELWRSTLDNKDFRISRNKTENMHCRFSYHEMIEVDKRLDRDCNI